MLIAILVVYGLGIVVLIIVIFGEGRNNYSRKREIDELWGINLSIENAIRKVEERINQLSKYKTCETCGCLINPNYAIVGKSEIRGETYKTISGKPSKIKTGYEYIYAPYYCKKCVPVKRTRKKTEKKGNDK